jgi:RNase P subunit RPR2
MLSHPSKPPTVICPGCKRPMQPGTAKPLLFAKGLADITYTCDRCGTKAVRTVKAEER